MIRPHRLVEESTFLGQTCALCKQEFGVGDEIVVCPEDGSRHHVYCWEANNNHCTAYGCKGEGEVGVPAPFMARPARQQRQTQPPPRPRAVEPPLEPPPPRARPAQTRPAARPIPNAPGSKVRTLPAGSFGCARGCLIAFLIIAILLVALACAGAWFLTESYALGPASYGVREIIGQSVSQFPVIIA